MRMSTMVRMVVLGLVSSAGAWGVGCDAGSGGSVPVTVTLGELSGVLDGGSARMEIQLAPGGAVRELHASTEVGHDEHLEGVVAAADFAGRALELEDIGLVEWTAGTRFRVPGESHATEAMWREALERARIGGAVVVRASRPARVGSPALDRFVATDLRLEDGRDLRGRLELWVGSNALDPVAETLTILGRVHALSGARLFDDDGVEVGDDHGDDGVEVGDDHGDDGVEVGDDHGDDGVEVGDDHGDDDGVEVGDDHGDDGVEVGDDHGDDGVEVGDDHGDDDGVEVGDDHGDDGVEVGDDHGDDDGVEVGDDHGGDDA